MRPSTAGGTRKRPFSQFTRSVLSVRTGIEEQADVFKKSDLETLLNVLRELIVLVEGRLSRRPSAKAAPLQSRG